ncbi:hypothetical protein B0E54_02366 [Micromonospora sp. MH99]|nr:hypothetical protein [Micromonospora sp. MH99]
MPEWTLCAEQKVYAGLHAVAKPATHGGLASATAPPPSPPMISADRRPTECRS